MQASGGPEEDTSGGFKYGGWTFLYFDDFSGKVMEKQMSKPFDLLLGRTAFEIFVSMQRIASPSYKGLLPKMLNYAPQHGLTNHYKRSNFLIRIIKK